MKSKVFRVGLDARIYESALGNTVKMEILKDNALRRKRKAVRRQGGTPGGRSAGSGAVAAGLSRCRNGGSCSG